MDLKQMRYFLMLAQEQNFGRAAAKLHITHSMRILEVSLLDISRHWKKNWA